jgi:hypothetical protein
LGLPNAVSDILRCTNWQGRTIVLTRKRWNDELLVHRPEFAGRLDIVREAIESPSFVYGDPGDSQWHFYYLQRNWTRWPELMVRIAVVFRRRELVQNLTGIVNDISLVPWRYPREQGEKFKWTMRL